MCVPLAAASLKAIVDLRGDGYPFGTIPDVVTRFSRMTPFRLGSWCEVGEETPMVIVGGFGRRLVRDGIWPSVKLLNADWSRPPTRGAPVMSD